MRLLPLLILLSLMSGCTAVMGVKQHTLSQSSSTPKSTEQDCGAMLGEPRAGGMLKMTGDGNSVLLRDEQQHVLVCATTDGADSMYLMGPLLPIIPMFGVGADDTPRWAEFIVVNYSNKANVLLAAEVPMQFCTTALQKNSFRCDTYSDGQTIEIPPQSVSRVRQPFSASPRLLINRQPLDFHYQQNLFFVFTG